MKKGTAIGIIVIIGLAAAVGIYFVLPKPQVLIYGTSSGPLTLDPMWAWDSASEDVIDQVYEGLYQYNLTNPSLPVVPWLATDMGNWTTDKMNFTVTIRPGITFQDGTPLDAAAVKWSFDRLQYLLNTYGNLTTGTA